MGQVIVLFGAPGSGKGTQGEMLEKQFGLPRVSTGDLFRALPDEGAGKEIQELMAHGSLVPDEKVIELLKQELAKSAYENGFILDGFPRTVPQAKALDALLAELNQALEAVVYLDASEAEIKRRLGGRWTCRECNKIYNFRGKPAAECSECGGALYQREDDTPHGIEQRLRTYRQKTAPLINYYQGKGVLRKVAVPDRAQKEDVFKLVLKQLGAGTENKRK